MNKQEMYNRDTEILILFALGNTQKQIAKKMYLSYHTVEDRKNRLMFEYDAKNKTHLVALALSEGRFKISK